MLFSTATNARTLTGLPGTSRSQPSPPGSTSSAQLASVINSQQSQKRPMNAFLIFCKRHRSVVREKYPLLENRSITKILGEWWAALDSDEKQNYTDLAKQYKEAFMKANPHFKWYKTADLRPPPPQQLQQQKQQVSQVMPVVSNVPMTTSTATVAMPILINANNGLIVQQGAAVDAKVNNLPPTTNNNETDSSVASVTDTLAATTAFTSSANTSNTTTSSNTNSSTPKPPKKRYLESMEAGGDYVKSKLTTHSLC